MTNKDRALEIAGWTYPHRLSQQLRDDLAKRIEAALEEVCNESSVTCLRCGFRASLFGYEGKENTLAAHYLICPANKELERIRELKAILRKHHDVGLMGHTEDWGKLCPACPSKVTP